MTKKVDSFRLEDIGIEIGNTLRKWGRVHVSQVKTKFESLRVYVSFGWWGLHSITHPGHAGLKLPKWLQWLDFNVFFRLMGPINFFVVPYQMWLYKKAYTKAVTENPDLAYEILVCADYRDLLEHLNVFVKTPEGDEND